jgi:pimeloyl-ACP methyl ester carboxylesterase
VEVTARALALQCEASARALELDEHDQVLLFSSLAFDASLEQWLLPLTVGATVHVMESLWSAARTTLEITKRGLTRLDLPPAYALTLAQHLAREGTPLPAGTLRSCTVGGEAVSSPGLLSIRDSLRPTRLINAYGPTEAVITPTSWTLGTETLTELPAYAPIGTPLAGRVAYVLDACLGLLPVGAVGELYLGGEPLARGYRNEPARTAERFVPDPFVTGARMLRTGDRVRLNADGVLEFVARTDEQLKIRGFRVELGEVHAALARHPAVRDVAVLAEQRGELSVSAYAVADGVSREALLVHLRTLLPAYAVPAQLVLLPSIPRTPNGKVDARALRSEASHDGGARVRVEPQGELEQRIARAFAEVLGRSDVGATDNFFELGGHSLRALTLVSLLERDGTLTVRLSDLVFHPTVQALARALLSTQPGVLSPLVRLNGASREQPLFCFHPAGGACFGYTELARALAPQRQVYGFVCRTLLDPTHRDRSIAQLGVDYAEHIVAAQPRGPYSLLGWSLGGAIALAAAAELEARGHEVRFLGLVDGFVPGFDDELDAALPEPPSAPPAMALFHDSERAAGQLTLVHLTALSRSFVLPRLETAPTCWWSSEGRALRSAVQRALERGLGRAPRASEELATTHEEIVKDPAFLRSLALRLEESARADEEESYVR